MSSAEAFEACIRGGGVVLFPSDTVYGLACDPNSERAVRRLYEIKGRPPAKASAIMFFDLHAALHALPRDIGDRTRTALHSLMPGGVTVLLENPTHLWPLACAEDPGTLGLRVIDVPALRAVSVAVLQSSANLSGGPEARRLEDVSEPVRAAVDLEIDGGELPGIASTVVDLRGYERDGADAVRVLRAGLVPEESVRAALSGQSEFDELQDQLAAAGGDRVRRILELGTGTGQTAIRLLRRHPDALLLGIDESEAALRSARETLPAERVELRVSRFQDPLPPGPFELVASALALHHVQLAERPGLVARAGEVLGPGGRLVLAEIVAPETDLAAGYEKAGVEEHLGWLRAAGLRARVHWARGELAVLVGEKPGE